MVGNSVWALTSTVDLNGASTIFAAHDGASSERPGISEVIVHPQPWLILTNLTNFQAIM